MIWQDGCCIIFTMISRQSIENEGGYHQPITLEQLRKLRQISSTSASTYPDMTVDDDRRPTARPLHYCSVNKATGQTELVMDEDIFDYYSQRDAEKIRENPKYLLEYPVNLRAFSFMEPAEFSTLVTYYEGATKGALGEKKAGYERLFSLFRGLHTFLFRDQDGELVKDYFNGRSIQDYVQVISGLKVAPNLEVRFGDIFSLSEIE